MSKTLLQRIEALEAVVFGISGSRYVPPQDVLADTEGLFVNCADLSETPAPLVDAVYHSLDQFVEPKLRSDVQEETTAILPDEEEAQTDGEVETDDDEQDDG